MRYSTFDVRRSTFDVQTRMTNDLNAEEVRALLKLEPHATCGFVRVTFISNQRIAPGGLPAPFLDGRPAGLHTVFHGHSGCAGAPASHPQRSALSPLLG